MACWPGREGACVEKTGGGSGVGTSNVSHDHGGTHFSHPHSRPNGHGNLSLPPSPTDTPDTMCEFGGHRPSSTSAEERSVMPIKGARRQPCRKGFRRFSSPTGAGRGFRVPGFRGGDFGFVAYADTDTAQDVLVRVVGGDTDPGAQTAPLARARELWWLSRAVRAKYTAISRAVPLLLAGYAGAATTAALAIWAR